MDILFFKVFRNIYLRSLILNNVNRFIKTNKHVHFFKSVEKLYQYQDREFIVKKLVISNNEMLPQYSLPYNLEELEFLFYRYEIQVNTIGENLIKLTLSNDWNRVLQPNIFNICSKLKEIKFGESYNKPLKINIFKNCNSLELIIFGDRYNQVIPIGALSNLKSLKEIKFNEDFDKVILENSLPSSVKTIIFGNSFNQQFKNVNQLPNNLETLIFGFDYNQEIRSNTLPNSITFLNLGLSFNNILIKDSLPKELLHLKFSRDYNQLIGPGILPNKLKSIEFDYEYNQPILKNQLPESLEKLKFYFTFNQPLVNLNIGLKSLKLSDYFNVPLSDPLPSSLTKLRFGRDFNSQIIDSNILPKSLKSIEFGTKFNQQITCSTFSNCINLTTINLQSEFNYPLNGNELISCSNTLEVLSFGSYFNQLVNLSHLVNLKYLFFGRSFSKPINIENCNSLISLTILNPNYNINDITFSNDKQKENLDLLIGKLKPTIKKSNNIINF